MPKEITYLSPRKGKVIAFRNRIDFPAMSLWEAVAIEATTTPGASRPPQMTKAIEGWKQGEYIDLAQDGRICLGVAAGLIVKISPLGRLAMVFNQYDATHQHRPLEWTPPAGILGRRNIIAAALQELGEEVIVTVPQPNGQTEVWSWVFNGKRLCEPWVEAYAKAHNMIMTNKVVKVDSANDLPGLTELHFGQRVKILAWVAFEPDIGSVEVILPLVATLPPGAILKDGEILPNGKYRHSRIVPFLLTSKAEVVARAFFDIK